MSTRTEIVLLAAVRHIQDLAAVPHITVQPAVQEALPGLQSGQLRQPAGVLPYGQPAPQAAAGLLFPVLPRDAVPAHPEAAEPVQEAVVAVPEAAELVQEAAEGSNMK